MGNKDDSVNIHDVSILLGVVKPMHRYVNTGTQAILTSGKKADRPVDCPTG